MFLHHSSEVLVTRTEEMHLLVVRATPTKGGVALAKIRTIDKDVQTLDQFLLFWRSLAAKVGQGKPRVANNREVTARTNAVHEFGQRSRLRHWLAARERQPLDFWQGDNFLRKSRYRHSLSTRERQRFWGYA